MENFDLDNAIIIEGYRNAKTELIKTIELQYHVLYLVLTATAAVFVFIFGSQVAVSNKTIVLCAWLLIPGIFAFFGILWLDLVYRQRRLGAYLYHIESQYGLTGDDSYLGYGCEHFLQNTKDKPAENKSQRLYYYICVAMFYVFPFGTMLISCMIRTANVLFDNEALRLPAIIGVIIYGCYIVCSIIYINAILRLKALFKNKEQLEAKNTMQKVLSDR